MAESAHIEEVKEKLGRAEKVVVLTGAGVSAESGVPTFRGSGGLWNNYRAEELATPEAFLRDPKLVWQWYGWRRDNLRDILPNPAHLAIAAMEESFKGFSLITQNVDGLHKMAGSKKILELHGNIWRTRCTTCREVRETRELPNGTLPKCEKAGCGALLRPDIVWFGEALDSGILTGALNAVDSAEIIIVAGTSAQVQPAASFAMRAKERGAFVVEVNPAETPVSDYVDLSFRDKAGEVMPLFL
jgi:NAD-dependent deacetylase